MMQAHVEENKLEKLVSVGTETVGQPNEGRFLNGPVLELVSISDSLGEKGVRLKEDMSCNR